MKAEIVRNLHDEPRLVLTFESDEERALFEGGPRLAPCVETREGDDEDRAALIRWSFALEQDDTLCRCDGNGGPCPPCDRDEHGFAVRDLVRCVDRFYVAGPIRDAADRVRATLGASPTSRREARLARHITELARLRLLRTEDLRIARAAMRWMRARLLGSGVLTAEDDLLSVLCDVAMIRVTRALEDEQLGEVLAAEGIAPEELVRATPTLPTEDEEPA